jgi:hypothetical protein
MTIKISTVSGIHFDPFNPRSEDVFPDDVVGALARNNRYNGHIEYDHYSVAEHSVHIEAAMRRDGVPARTRALGLMHDAPESFISDMIRPLKPYAFFVKPGGTEIVKFEELEERIFYPITEVFFPGVKWTKADWKIVHRYDTNILKDEFLALRPKIPPNPEWLGIGAVIEGWPPRVAIENFWRAVHTVSNDIANGR